MITRPSDIFDRELEWKSLAAFVESDIRHPTLGIVYGRRRQGKTLLLETLCDATDGFFFEGMQGADAQNLARISERYSTYVQSRAPIAFSNWGQVFDALLSLGEADNTPVVIDEFPYLIEGDDSIASELQNALRPGRNRKRNTRVRLILCGSAYAIMRKLLSGTAPLRGRSSLELVVPPFPFRTAGKFWGLADQPATALKVDAIVGGTPSYLTQCGFDRPTEDFDRWVVERILTPSSAMFNEGEILVSEAPSLTDRNLYVGALAAIAAGKRKRHTIADSLGRPDNAVAFPLDTLERLRLVRRHADAFKARGSTYTISEPMLRFHERVIRPNRDRLMRGHAVDVWTSSADTVSSQIYGPHFEQICRDWTADHASVETLSGTPSRVDPATVACPHHRTSHQIDVVAIDRRPNEKSRLLAVGEAKWRSQPVGIADLAELTHKYDQIRTDLDQREVKLLLFSRSGFTAELAQLCVADSSIVLVDLDRLYSGD